MALLVQPPPIWLLLLYVGLFVLYGGILWLLKELGKEDWETFKRVVPLERFTSGGEPTL